MLCKILLQISKCKIHSLLRRWSAILDTGAAPIYQQIAPKAFHLQQLGLSNSAIAKRLGVTDKTVAKAIDWFWRIGHRPNGKKDVLQSTH